MTRAARVAFRSEADLCAQFAAAARADGWTAYSEQGGWDILLVRGAVQVGVQAKLEGVVDVLLQALPDLRGVCARRRVAVARGRRVDPGVPGPVYRAVLVGGWTGRTPAARHARREAFYRLAIQLRVLVLEPPLRRSPRTWVPSGFRDNLAANEFNLFSGPHLRFYRWRPDRPVWTPPFVPALPAGVPNPRVVGPWQLAAVRLELRARERGWVSLTDAREVTSEVEGTWDPRTLLQKFYRCTSTPLGDGARGNRWVLRPRVRAAGDRYPEVAAAFATGGP